MNNYDIGIIGGGIGGFMAAYRLKKNNPELSIAIFDKGKKIEDRKCYAAENHTKCIHCNICDITSGYAGSGSFSDAKYNLGTAYGGTLGEEIGDDNALKYINEVDNILHDHSTDYPEIYYSDDELKALCLQNNLRLLDMNVRHLGTYR